jgi:hypothetical protein
VGKDKAMVFKPVLNLTEQDAVFLKYSILDGLVRNEAVLGIQDQYGKRFTINIKNHNLDKEALNS